MIQLVFDHPWFSFFMTWLLLAGVTDIVRAWKGSEEESNDDHL